MKFFFFLFFFLLLTSCASNYTSRIVNWHWLPYPVFDEFAFIIKDISYECYGVPCGENKQYKCSICKSSYMLQPFRPKSCLTNDDSFVMYMYFSCEKCLNGLEHQLPDDIPMERVTSVSKCKPDFGAKFNKK